MMNRLLKDMQNKPIETAVRTICILFCLVVIAITMYYSDKSIYEKVLFSIALAGAVVILFTDLFPDTFPRNRSHIKHSKQDHSDVGPDNEKKYYIADELGNQLTTEPVTFDQANRFVINYNAINADKGRSVQLALQPTLIFYNDEESNEEGNNDEKSEQSES